MLPEPKAPSVKNYPKSTDAKWAQMGYWLFPLLIFNFSFLIFQCGLDVEDPTPPSPPVWVQKSLPEEWPERGIDAHEYGGICLEWLPNSEIEDVTSYYLYRASMFENLDSLSEYEVALEFVREESLEPKYIDLAVLVGTRYFYKLKAKDLSGNMSLFSDSISYMLLPRVINSNMFPNGLTRELDSSRSLSWIFFNEIAMEDYTITLVEHENLLTRSVFTPTNYIGRKESWGIPIEIFLTPGETYRWRVDMGAQYEEERETAGAESTWATFLFTQ